MFSLRKNKLFLNILKTRSWQFNKQVIHKENMARFVMKQFVRVNLLTRINFMSEKNHYNKIFMNNKIYYIVQVLFTNVLLRLQL